MPVRILVVDDDVDTRQSTVAVLSRAGYVCCQASDGDQALSLIDRHGCIWDVVLLDYDLGRTKPTGVVAGMLIADRCEGQKLIIMSGYTEIDLGAMRGVKFLEKPVKREDLLAAIAEQLAARAPA